MKLKMSFRASGLAQIVLVVLGASLITAQATDSHGRPNPFEFIRELNVKLNLDGSPTFKLDELTDAWEEFNSWTEDEKKAARSWIDYRLVIDIALAPMQLAYKPDVSTIKEAYKAYRSAYLYGSDLGLKLLRRDDKRSLEALYASLIGSWDTPLTWEAFVEAKDDALFFLNELNDLVEKGLVYEKRTEFEERINFFNRTHLRTLMIYVFPAMNYINDIEALRLLYFQKLPLSGIIYLEKGRTEFSVHWDEKAGFAYVV